MATTIEQNTLEAEPRESGTKNQARRVRREGKIPGVVYGAGKHALSVSVDPRHVLRILRSDSGHNTIFDLALNGGERTKAMIVDWPQGLPGDVGLFLTWGDAKRYSWWGRLKYEPGS